MLYVEFMNKVCEICLDIDTPSGKSYIIPEYKIAMQIENLDPSDVTDYNITIADVKESLELEVIRRNTIIDNVPIVTNWLFDIISSNLEEYKTESTNAIAEQFIDFLKQRNAAKETEEKKEPLTHNFSKKEI